MPIDPSDDQPVDTVVLDVDGTLVDTVYQHTSAWSRALAEVGVDVPTYRIHRAIGMGADRLVGHVAGDRVEEQHGDAIRSRHDELFDEVLDAVRPLPGAGDLITALRRRGLKVVLASSGEPGQTQRLLDIVGADDRPDGRVTTDEVEHSKPAPDLIEAAIAEVGGDRAAVVGDAIWDVLAGRDGGHYCIGLLTGGFGEAELRDAGADRVYATPQDLVDDLDHSPLRGGG